VKTGNLVFISGQIPKLGDELKFVGTIGQTLTTEDGIEAAKICVLNVLAHLRTACGGDLDKVKRCVKLGVWVNSTSEFTNQPGVANGASELICQVFGEAGQHSRFAVSAPSLPFGVATEVEAVFEVEE